MKKKLLLVASVFFGASAFAQFTDANAPAIGDATNLFIVDSLAPSLASETGAGAVWDYSGLLGYQGENRTITIKDPAVGDHGMSFPLSTGAQDLQGFLSNFSISDATGRVSQGFVFDDQVLGEVVAIFDTDGARTHTYPMDETTAAVSDSYIGTVDYIFFGAPQNSPVTGEIVSQVDGKGTLKLAGNDYTDVLRYKSIDTMKIVSAFGVIQLIRVQFEYYDHTVGKLPIFVHTNLKISQGGGSPITDITFVLSKDQPTSFVSVSTNEMENTSVYPNPADNNLNIQLPSSIETAEVVITDALGRQVYASTLNAAVKTIDVSKLNKGMYFVTISNDVYSTTKNVVVK